MVLSVHHFASLYLVVLMFQNSLYTFGHIECTHVFSSAHNFHASNWSFIVWARSAHIPIVLYLFSNERILSCAVKPLISGPVWAQVRRRRKTCIHNWISTFCFSVWLWLAPTHTPITRRQHLTRLRLKYIFDFEQFPSIDVVQCAACRRAYVNFELSFRLVGNVPEQKFHKFRTPDSVQGTSFDNILYCDLACSPNDDDREVGYNSLSSTGSYSNCISIPTCVQFYLE